MDFRLPELGEGVYEAELVSWLVKTGDSVKRGQNLLEAMTDKASMEVPSPFAGTIESLAAEPGRQIKVGDVVLTYTPAGSAANGPAPAGELATPKAKAEERRPQPAARASSPATPLRTPKPVGTNRLATAVKAAPSVRYLARKLGVDLTQVLGSGPGGRVLLEDVTSFVPSAGAPAKRPPAEVHPDYGTPGTRLRLQGVRRKIAEHMVQAKHTIPHYSYVDECEVTELVRLREALRETYAGAGLRLTYLAFFVKAVVGALKEVPIVNASLNDAAGEIILHDRYQIGIAVATPQGLIVPVIRDADRKDLAQILREIERLSSDARAGKARREDLRGGTFTITSVGSIGGLISTPIINHPEVAILGLGRVVKRPVYDAAGNLRPADLIYLSLSFDHRVVDGAIGAAFGNAIIRRLQNPAALLLPAKLI
jgi:2-oxoisovalerate dehydrogenase E2 component (dihydrolipoyl transacylase)